MKYSYAANIMLHILDTIKEYEDSIPKECYSKIRESCNEFLIKLHETFLDNETNRI